MLLAYLPFLVLGLCTVSWLLAASRRVGLPLAVGGVLAASLIVVMASLFVSAALQLDPLTVAMATAGLGGAAGLVVLRRTEGALRRPQAATIARWAPASIGALAWIVVVALAPLIPGAAPLSWTMNGDTANNLHIGRYFVESNGLTTRHSLPLSGALLLLGMAPGRVDSGKAELLHHDLVAFSVVWTLELALTAVLLGLVASALLPSGRRATTVIASASGSLLVTTWYLVGLPLEFGYLNMHLAMPFLLASWLVYLQSPRRPVVAIAVELGLGVLLLTTWTPLIVFTVAFVVAIMLRHRAALRALTGRSLAVVAVSAGVFLVPFGVLAIPELATSVGTLMLPGHGLPFTGWLLLPLAGSVAVCAILLRRRSGLPLVSGAVSLGAAAVVCIGVLLFISRQNADPWSTYYPAKATWLVTAVLVPIAMSFLFRAFDEFLRSRRAATAAVTALAALGLVLASVGPPPIREAFVITPPLQKILTGTVWSTGDAAVETVLRFTSADRSHILWDTNDPDEAIINFWILELGGGDVAGNEALRDFSLRGYRGLRQNGSYHVGDITELCTVVEQLEPPVVVHTANPGLASALDTACPNAGATVAVDG